ncbi:hypothetical protein EVAR_77023_1 [Eumeta japonica]|uniref:Uncharacterized protein n=1 Tax=Eumeta variegata TaxID=151549 RepID=A0A4C1SI72_EUMVA|nr:hypothetical protein EVAR_77023_1 [Eumeta japonica]
MISVEIANSSVVESVAFEVEDQQTNREISGFFHFNRYVFSQTTPLMIFGLAQLKLLGKLAAAPATYACTWGWVVGLLSTALAHE